ncbi:SURF1 family protein [Luteococcus peritonei]|uniref:SURF1-like protein n=1 Tax=Luteococcus peritonei TaxID=88874 RepID=A0ABW4S0I0_9ACTN
MTQRLKQLLVALGGGAICLLFVFLGLWQMQVFESQKSDSTAQRAAEPPRELEANLTAEGKVGDLYGRTVTVSGHYLPAAQHLVGTERPLRVLTAFRTDQGRTLAVVRGTTDADEAPAPPTGQQTVEGIILPTQGSDGGPVSTEVPAGTMSTVRLEQLVQEWPTPMLDGFVTLKPALSEQQGLVSTEAPVPDTEGGRVRNQGYALQWWAFAGFGAVLTTIAVRNLRPRDED